MPKMTITSPYKNKKPATKGISLGAKKADKLFRFMKKEGLLEDRAEYDEDSLKSAYHDLNDKETKPKKASENSQEQEPVGKAGFRKYPDRIKEQVITWHKEGKKPEQIVADLGGK